MKGLLIKDFKLLKGQKNFFLLILIVTIGLVAFTDNISLTIGFTGFVLSSFSLNTISFDEFDNGNAFLFSLPITRTEYVVEKYGFGLILGLGAWIFTTLLVVLAEFFRGSSFSIDMAIIALSLVPFILLLLAVMYPFHLKFGADKGRLAIIGTMGLIFVIVYIISKITEALNIDIVSILNHLPTLNQGMLTAGAIVIAILLLLLSMKISMSIMRKKQF